MIVKCCVIPDMLNHHILNIQGIMGGNSQSNISKQKNIAKTITLVAGGTTLINTIYAATQVAEGGIVAQSLAGVGVAAQSLAGVGVAGSFLGIATQAEAILGFSTAANSGILGMSAATIAGGVVIIVGLAALGLWLYYRKKQSSSTVEEAISQTPLSRDQLQTNDNGVNIPDFHPISMTQSQFANLESLTQKRYVQKVKEFICPVSYQVMRRPCLMRCCKKHRKKAEKAILQDSLKRLGRCALCHSPAQMDFIELDDDTYEAILGFRQRLVKTYASLLNGVEKNWSGEKKDWIKRIDDQFGTGYTKKHLQNFKCSDSS